MEAEKIRNLTDVELLHQEKDLADQLFKLKFQMNMGQTESLKKIRGLRRDIARVQTVRREQEIAGAKSNAKSAKPTTVAVSSAVATAVAKPVAKPAAKSAAKSVKKSAAKSVSKTEKK
jgi:large subunit ribosomal protein L29